MQIKLLQARTASWKLETDANIRAKVTGRLGKWQARRKEKNKTAEKFIGILRN